MATAAVSHHVQEQFLLPGISTKGLNCYDAFARLIARDFVELVDPRMLIMYLPTELLTPSDEERVVAMQERSGRQEGAKVLLALLCQRGDWVPRLQTALRHRQIGLPHLADKIDRLQTEVTMEIDIADDTGEDMLMEVDAVPEQAQPSQQVPQSQTRPGQEPVSLLQGLSQVSLAKETNLGAAQEPPAPPAGQPRDVQAILKVIAENFFCNLARSPEDVRQLTELYERIAQVLTTSVAVGCLQLRLRIPTSRDLHQLRQLAESGVLQEAVERALLTEKRREWLREKAASYGLKWRVMKVKVTFDKQDLQRCHAFLKAKEEVPVARNTGEALLQKAFLQRPTSTADLPEDHIETLPDLLKSFLQSLVDQHAHLAVQVATILATHSLETGLKRTIDACQSHFGLSSEVHDDLEVVCSHLPWTARRAKAESKRALQDTEAPEESVDCSGLYVKAMPESYIARSVDRLVEAKLMKPVEVTGEEHSFCFLHPFVADYGMALSANMQMLHDNIHGVVLILDGGSRFAVLPFLALMFQRHMYFGKLVRLMSRERFPSTVIAMCLIWSREVLKDFRFFTYADLGQKVFGPATKKEIRLQFGVPITSVSLCPLTNIELRDVADVAGEVLSARVTMDLSGKLTDLTAKQVTVILGCAQFTNLADFQLYIEDEYAVLKLKKYTEQREDTGDTKLRRKMLPEFGHPALKLCRNNLTAMHVQCLLQALGGMEHLSHMDLSHCTIDRDHLQQLLHQLPGRSLKTLILNEIRFRDSRVQVLPKFSHLKRLQAVELSFLGLQDHQMTELSEQLADLPDLREVTLDDNPITTEGLSLLTPALAGCSTLRTLRVARCQLDAGGAYVLGAMLTSALSLHVLNVSQCRLLDSGLQHLTVALKRHNLLSKVSLRDGGYSPHGLSAFFSHLSRCPRMQHLELGKCPLEEDGCDVSERFLKALAASYQWDCLGLWHCRVGHTSLLQQLGTLSQQLRGVSRLVLQENDIDDTQLGHLAQAVRQGALHHIKHLNLSQNPIKGLGVQHLIQILPLLPHMSELLMQHCALTAGEASSLAEAVLRLPNMTLLDVSHSSAMGRYDVIEAMSKVEQVVREPGIIVDVPEQFGGKYDSLEQQFIEDKLELIKLGSSKAETAGEAMTEEMETVEIVPDVRESVPERVPTLEKYVKSTEEKLESIAGSPQPVESPKTDVAESPVVRRREMSGREGNILVFDEMLRVSFGH